MIGLLFDWLELHQQVYVALVAVGSFLLGFALGAGSNDDKRQR